MNVDKRISIELKGAAEKAYEKLNQIVGEQKAKGIKNSEEIALWIGIQRVFDLLESNPFYGDNAKKKLIPKYYIKKYGVENLFIANLPLYWRMIYTIESNKIEIILFVLDIFNHNDYNKRFNFKKR
ncbi:MAG: hypothetical protein KAU20_07425 [Nanoarchaeota archaeon]|nr:hypothetical protein [Nanoarchaeota archaeon]